MFEQILEKIRRYDTILIHRHTNPDGDAIGAQVGLRHIILANFPEKQVFAVGDPPKRYAFMEDSAPATVDDSLYKGALAIILDTSSPALISDGRYTLAAETVRMDHHIFLEKIADTEVVDTSFESCCGLITAFALEAGLTVPDLAAKSLFTGMVTDSGRFRFDSVTPRTYRLAASLAEHSFCPADIYRELYSDDIDMMRLRAKFVLKITFSKANVAYIYTSKAEAESYNADSFTISRGMVSTMSDIRGVDIWVNFTETATGVLCEIRSNKFNINPIAVKYGGGGHAKASGATLRDREEAMCLLHDLEKLQEGNAE